MRECSLGMNLFLHYGVPWYKIFICTTHFTLFSRQGKLPPRACLYGTN